MPTTPPPASARAHTPPTPLHGVRYDSYEPYSPRRSSRRTAQNNPYSSSNGERSPRAHNRRTTTPPTTIKKTRFARAPTQLSSPPSSPSSPILRSSTRQQKNKSAAAASRVVNGVHSDSDNPAVSLIPHSIDPTSMLPTPSKTPRKRQIPALTGTARILSFQPSNPNDVMPSPRKIKTRTTHRSDADFDLYEEEAEHGTRNNVEIFMDTNARIPQRDDGEGNPFVGKRKPLPGPSTRQTRKSKAQREEDERIDEAARRDEGVTYIFRGRKIFRKFSDHEQGEGSSSAATEIDASLEQRALKRQAGEAAQRPLTRSAIKPRLLFPSRDQLEEHHSAEMDVYEEATTDIEAAHAAPDSAEMDISESIVTPAKAHTSPRTRKVKKAAVEETSELVPEASSATHTDPECDTDQVDKSSLKQSAGKRRSRNLFESWPRTKAGAKRARESGGGDGGGGGTKRTRNATSASNV